MRDTITVASRCQSGYWVSGRRWSNAKALFRIFLRALTRRFYLAHFSVTENFAGAGEFRSFAFRNFSPAIAAATSLAILACSLFLLFLLSPNPRKIRGLRASASLRSRVNQQIGGIVPRLSPFLDYLPPG